MKPQKFKLYLNEKNTLYKNLNYITYKIYENDIIKISYKNKIYVLRTVKQKRLLLTLYGFYFRKKENIDYYIKFIEMLINDETVFILNHYTHYQKCTFDEFEIVFRPLKTSTRKNLYNEIYTKNNCFYFISSSDFQFTVKYESI